MKKNMKVIKLENLIYLTIIFLPAYLVKFVVFDVPFNLLEVLIIATLAWSFFLIPKNKILDKKTSKYIIIFGVILLGLVISTAINGNFRQGAGIIKGWFLLPFLLGLFINKFIPEEKKLNIFLCLYFSAFFVSCVSLVYFFFGKITYDGRLQSFFNSPNYLAMYLAPAIIIGAVLLKKRKSEVINLFLGFKLTKRLLSVFLLIIVVCLFLTYSLSAWISLAVVLWGILYFPKIKLKTILYSAIVLLVLLITVQLNFSKINNLVASDGRSSFSSRIMIWKSAEKMLGDSWILGIGPGNFQEKYLLYQKYFPPYLEWAVPHPHNLFLAFWLYGGIVGLLGFLCLILFWIKETLSRKQKDDIFFIASGIMTYILVHGVVDTTYFKNDLAVVFWMNFFSLL
jgi:putative inorganic carbon (hco3(-)) transporter